MTGIEFSIAAGLTIAGTTIASTATLVGIGLSLALSALSSMLFRPSLPSFRGPSQMIKAPTAPRQTVYGEIKTSGVVTFVHIRSSDSKRLLIAVAVASHKVQSFQLLSKGMWIADEIALFSVNDPVTAYGANDRGNESTTSQFVDYAHINVAMGTTTQAAFVNMVARSETLWTSTHQQKGVAGFAMELHFHRKVYPTNIPNLAVYLKGHAEIYDPRDLSTAYKNNAALIIRHYLLTPKSAGGFGATSSEISETAFTSAANTCDENVTLKATTAAGAFVTGNIYVIKTVGTTNFVAIGASASTVGITFTATGAGSGTGDAYNTEKRYAINMQYTWDMLPATILQGMLSACAGKLYNINGQWTLYVGAAITPTWTLTEADVVGPIEILGRAAREDRFNAVKGTYMSPTNNWEESDFVPVVNATYKTEDNNELIYRDVKFPATTSDPTAQRLAKIILEDHRQSLTVKARCQITALQTMGGDWINVTLSRYGWSAKVFEVLEHTPAIEDGFLFFDLILKETASAIYTWSHLTNETTVDLAPNTNLGDPFTVTAPSSFTLTADPVQVQDGRYEGRIRAEWSIVNDAFVEEGGRFQLEWKKSTESDYNHKQLVNVASAITDYKAYLQPVVADGATQYNVRIKSINLFGAESTWTSANVTPADVTSVWYDDIGPTPNAVVNECVNPSFEDDGYGWRDGHGTGAGSFSQPASSPKYGSKVGRLVITTVDGDGWNHLNTVNEAQSAAENKSIPVTASTTYHFSAWAKVVSGGGTAVLSISQWQSGGTFISGTEIGSSTASSWAQILGTMTLASNCAYVSVMLAYNAIGTCDFDGVHVRKTSTSYAFDAGIVGRATAVSVVQGSQPYVTVATLAASVTIAEGSGWTEILAIRQPLSLNAVTLTAEISANFFATVDINSSTSVTVEFQILRNGTSIRASGASRSTADSSIDVPAIYHVDTTLTPGEAVIEYRLQARKTTTGTNDNVVKAETPCAMSVRINGV